MLFVTGVGLCRFELQVKPGQEEPRLVLRLLKFIKPPNPDDKVFQKEGELVKIYSALRGIERPFTRSASLLSEESFRVLKDKYCTNPHS
jgi:hypothetical protein